jgi:Tol biopolymer transport system component
VDTEGDRHLIVRDLQTGRDIRLTPAGEAPPTLDAPSWSPSGDEVVFATGPATERRIVSRRTDGSGGQRMVAAGLVGQITTNHTYFVFLVDDGGTTRLRYATLAADGSVGAAQRVFAQSDPQVAAFDLSPDGSTLAYSVPEADSRLNTFLTDFPTGRRQVQVTTTGGAEPRFSGDGNALFYLARALPYTDPPRGALAMLPVALKSLAATGPPVQILAQGKEPPGITWPLYDVARDGRLLTMRRTGSETLPRPRLLLVQNWRGAMGR